MHLAFIFLFCIVELYFEVQCSCMLINPCILVTVMDGFLNSPPAFLLTLLPYNPSLLGSWMLSFRAWTVDCVKLSSKQP